MSKTIFSELLSQLIYFKTAYLDHLKVPISQRGINPFWGLNQSQSNSWLSLCLFVKMAPELVFTKELSQVLGLNKLPCLQAVR